MTLYPVGTLVQARSRLWRVDAQEERVLYVSATDDSQQQARLYLPIESVQPGQLPTPDPTFVGYPQAQDLMLRAFRLSMVNSTAPFLSLQRSRAIPVAYQLVPLVMALDQSRVRLLIADDIGLGKTIEAGLILTELMARGLARRVLIVCPAGLREQWREALAYFFHLDTHILSRQHRRALERDLPVGANPWEFHNAFVVSVDYAKTPEIKNQILEVSWDVVVIDEAHQLAKPHQTSADHRVNMDRWELGKALAFSPRVRHLLLLTATPHNGYTDSFASLLRLLNVEAVSGLDHVPLIRRGMAQRHVIQRRRQDVEAWLKGDGEQSAFPNRDQDEVIIRPSQRELDVIQLVQQYGDLVLQHAQSAEARLQALASWTVLHLHKRALSSPEALRRSLRNRRVALEQRLTGLAEEDAGLPSEAARANVLDEEPGEMFDEEELVTRSERVVLGERAALQAELKALDELATQAKKVTAKQDSKLQQLFNNLLRERLRYRSKVILFTRYRDTQEYIDDQIGKSPTYQDVTVITLHGGLNEVQRRERFAQFEAAKKAVLIATDAISEGVNLQHVASQIIHYELPWNPNRLEQRNGRIDRFGQREQDVVIRTLVMDETLDATILKVLVEKSRRIRADYGFSPPYFGDEANILNLISEHGLGLRLAPQQLSLFESLQEEQPEDPFNETLLARIQGESFYGQTDVSLSEVETRLRQVYATQGSPQEVQAFVLSGLNRLGCTVRENKDGTLRLHLAHPDLRLSGLDDELPRATFEPERGLNDSEVEVLDLGHPLVRRLLDVLKREAFQIDAQGESPRYGRTAAIVSPDVAEVTALYTVLVRFATGSQPPQILEDLLTVALPVYGDAALTPAATQHLLQARPASRIMPVADAQEALAEALNRADLSEQMLTKLEQRRAGLSTERQSLQQQLGQDAGWLKGVSDISIGSWDLLAVKILWPA